MKTDQLIFYGALGIGVLYLVDKFLTSSPQSPTQGKGILQSVAETTGHDAGAAAAAGIFSIPQGIFDWGYNAGLTIQHDVAEWIAGGGLTGGFKLW